MASVGSVTTDFVSGTPAGLKRQLKVWTRPGLDGVGALDVGKSDGRARLQLEHHDTQSNVETWIADIEALQGQVVSITPDWGTTYDGCLITEVSQPEIRPYNDGGTIKAIGRLTIRIERTE